MSNFMLEKIGSGGLYAVFHKDDGQGFFFLYRSETNEVLAQAQVYKLEPDPPLLEEDIEITWPTHTDTYLLIRGRTHCWIDVLTLKAQCGSKDDVDNLRISPDTDSSEDFKIMFVEARKKYWKEQVGK